MDNNSENIEYGFRSYLEMDLDQCAELARDAWPITRVVAPVDTKSLMKAYVRLSRLLSDFTLICYYKDKVIGFLFGITNFNYYDFKKRGQLLKLFWQFIVGRYGKIKRKYKFLISYILTFIKVEIICRRFDSEIILFVVDKNHRGKGIGSKLVDNFIEDAKRKEKKSIYLYTDVESNWQFYEKYGFLKYRDFHDNELSFLKGEKTMSFIYYKEII